MFIELAAAAFLIGRYVYHRLTEEPPQKERGELSLPITEDGAPVPHIFGRCRVSTPILAWAGPVTFEERVAGVVFDMRMDLFFVLGKGFEHGDAISTPISLNRILAVYVGDQKLGESPLLSTLTGNGGSETPSQISLVKSDYQIVGNLEFLNGGPAQQLVNSGASTYSGAMMISASPLGDSLSEDVIPGYRGCLSVCLFQSPLGFNHGRVNGLPSYQFEASSIATNPTWLATYASCGQDSNPILVIYEILTSPHLLGLSSSAIDQTTFLAAAMTLFSENHGYSRFWNARTSAADMLNDVLRQIDAILYFEHSTAKVCIKLVRADYSTGDLLEINKSNCRALLGFTMGGRTNLINKVRVTYPDREADYDHRSVTAHNMANAVGQDGQVAEESLEYLGCCTSATALEIAERELHARSRPFVKCRALVDRSFLRVVPGDAIRVVWSAPDINAVFRVVGVERGTPEDGEIALDLILDSAYVYRGRNPTPGDLGGNDIPVVIGG